MPVSDTDPMPFLPWVAWSDLFPAEGARDSRSATVVDALGRTGCYLLAHFGSPPQGAPKPEDPAVVYIGETHGATVSLASRLNGFARSAGILDGTPDAGHYAAWWYPWRFPERRPYGQALTSVQGLYASLAPAPDEVYDFLDGAGAWPLMVEGRAIWRHVAARGVLPALNNKGRARRSGCAPSLDGSALGRVLAWKADESAAEHAAAWLTQCMGIALGVQPWEADGGNQNRSHRGSSSWANKRRKQWIWLEWEEGREGVRLSAGVGNARSLFDSQAEGALLTAGEVQAAWAKLYELFQR